MKTSSTDKLLEVRKARSEALHFLPVKTLSCHYERYCIVLRNRLQGIRSLRTGEDCVPTIFDEISIFPDAIASLTVEGRVAIYDLAAQKFLTDFDYVSVQKTAGGLLVLKCSDGSCGLYNIKERKLLLSSGYDEFSPATNDYIWAKCGKHYSYIHRETGQVICPPCLIMAYDFPNIGLWGCNEAGIVSAYTTSGSPDPITFRRAVVDAGGFLHLHNYAYKIEHIVDVYGHILNV